MHEAALFAALVGATQDCITVMDRDCRIVFINAQGAEAFEVGSQAELTGRLWSALWPEEAAERLTASLEAALGGATVSFEAYGPTLKGAPRYWDVRLAPIYNGAAGNGAGAPFALAVARDITHRFAREERLRDSNIKLREAAADQAGTLIEARDELVRRDLLMREIDHRVKNSLSTIGGLLRMQARGAVSDDVRFALSEAANRVMTVSNVHARLYQSDDLDRVDLSGFVRALTEDLAAGLLNSNVRLSAKADAVEVDAREAVALGLIIAELTTNAVRHGFGEDGKGKIDVRVAAQGDGILLSVADSGQGLPEGFDIGTQTGLGMKIVSLYARQLEAEVTTRPCASGGACFDLRFTPANPPGGPSA